MKIQVEKKATQSQINKITSNVETSKSDKMKELFKLGLEVKEIATIMTELEGKTVRYNFVYNVISNYIRMNGIEVVENEKGESKKDRIIEMYKEGKSSKEIQIELKANSNYVFNTIKKYKLENGAVEKEA